MKLNRSIRTVMLFLLFGLISNVSSYAAQGRGQEKGKSDKQETKALPPGQGKVPPGQVKLPPGQVKKAARLSAARQQKLINEQQQRIVLYRQRLVQQQLLAQQYAAQLQTAKRLAAYQSQQEYLARLRQQELALRNSYNYDADPYFYTAPSYRYTRDGIAYETNEYGANALREAVNTGYAEGYRFGMADRKDGWTGGYKDLYAYKDANYGYNGYYSNQDEYNYYFRQGFSRGYEDGYNTRSQYGTNTGASHNVLGNIVQTILNLTGIN